MLDIRAKNPRSQDFYETGEKKKILFWIKIDRFTAILFKILTDLLNTIHYSRYYIIRS